MSLHIFFAFNGIKQYNISRNSNQQVIMSVINELLRD
jgi:hypothetical protein